MATAAGSRAAPELRGHVRSYTIHKHLHPAPAVAAQGVELEQRAVDLQDLVAVVVGAHDHGEEHAGMFEGVAEGRGLGPRPGPLKPRAPADPALSLPRPVPVLRDRPAG